MPVGSPAFEIRSLSSLTKVFIDQELHDPEVNSGTSLWNEVYSFQIAYRSHETLKNIRISVQSDWSPFITLRTVGHAPSELPTYPNPDAGYLRTTPGLYPDILVPLEEGAHAVAGQWRSVWVTVDLPPMAQSGSAGGRVSSSITLSFAAQDGRALGEALHTLNVLPAELPPQKLLHTQWFHSDCIATQYGVEVFSEEHWRLIEAYASNAYRHGINLLLTPLFTPPLDTAIGHERPTVQLVAVEQFGDGAYRFDFSLLDRWVDMCGRIGIRHFEFSHLFTQWGAKHAPKIMAKVNGEDKRIFGWDTDAAGGEYRSFLDQFLPELVTFIRTRGIEKQVYFHISDEPLMEHMDNYRQASEILKKHLHEFPFLDALSNYEFYKHGLVDIAIPSNDHIEDFIEQKIDPLWTYYCCAQSDKVSNRFFSLPSYRNRIIGLQFYKFGVKGFLHWGFNFWYSQYSAKAINPYLVTDADVAFPSGDAFAVYPGADGPVDSLRWEVFREGLQDLRALELLESLTGKEHAMALIEEGLVEPIAFNRYPHGADWLLDRRARINAAIAEAMA
ncbi:DUF4091 domain-containing protein [Paenibacillus sp. strain BS8-2]